MQELFENHKTNKAESNDATQDKIEDFNEDTCNVCAPEFLIL